MHFFAQGFDFEAYWQKSIIEKKMEVSFKGKRERIDVKEHVTLWSQPQKISVKQQKKVTSFLQYWDGPTYGDPDRPGHHRTQHFTKVIFFPNYKEVMMQNKWKSLKVKKKNLRKK